MGSNSASRYKIVELGQTFQADANGQVSVWLVPGWYTLKATSTSTGTPYASTLKLFMWEAHFSIFLDPTQNLNIDYSDGSDDVGQTFALSTESASAQSIPIEPTIPTSVTIWSTRYNRPWLFSAEGYVKAAVSGEVNNGFYSSLTSAQQSEMYKALAITARSHLDYFMTATDKCSQLRKTYKIDDTTNCQKIDYNYPGGDVIESAVNSTSHQIMIYINDFRNGRFEYVAGLFFASDNGSTISSAQKYNAPHPYLQSETDLYDEEISQWVCANKPTGNACPYPRVGGYHGPGVGLSHDGAAGYAKHNYAAASILGAFYRGVSIYTASDR